MNENYFLPGNNFTIKDSWRRNASPVYTELEVNSPGRIHCAVLDFGEMEPGLGGGGIGISTSTVRNKIVVGVGEKGGANQLSGQHLLELFKTMTNYQKDDIYIRAPEKFAFAHGGFGSNVTYNTSVLAGLNVLFGSPYSLADIWDIVTSNYIENASDGIHIYLGLDTGLGQACLLHGGFVWIDPWYGKYIGNIATQDLWVVTATGKIDVLRGDLLEQFEGNAEMSDKTEVEIVGLTYKKYQKQYGKELHEYNTKTMKPAFYQNDIEGLLKASWDMNEYVNVRAQKDIYHAHVIDDIKNVMKESGALFAGMTSAGPGYYAFAKGEAEANRLKKILEEGFSESFSNFSAAKAGEKLKINIKNTDTPDQTVYVAEENLEPA